MWFCNRRRKQRKEDEEAKVLFSEAVILDIDSSRTFDRASKAVADDAVVSSQDPYPLEQLSETSDIYPFH